jgi:hypothetical protein
VVRDLLKGWYPGLGEVEAIRRMPAPVRRFLSEAADRDPSFVSEYIVPRLSQPNPYSMIVSDIMDALEVRTGGVGDRCLGIIDPQWISGLSPSRLATAARGVTSRASLGGGGSAGALVSTLMKATPQQRQAILATVAPGAAQVAAAVTRQQVPDMGNGFLDTLRSLTTDQSIIAQGQAIRQREMNAMTAGVDGDIRAAQNEEKAMIASLQKARDEAQKAAILAQGVKPQDKMAIATQMVKQLETQQAQAQAVQADPVARKAKADADAAAATAKVAEQKAMQDQAIAYAKKRDDDYDADIIARISRGEPVARAEYVRVYGTIKPGGGHPYVDWTAYEAANGRVHTSWLSKIAGPVLAVVGAVLAPFTGGASLVAASLLTAAARASSAAGQANVARGAATYTDATRPAAGTDPATSQANADLLRQVDDFFRTNQAWFAQHGITPDAWSRMTLDQKIEVIRAGATGTPVQNIPSSGGSAPSSGRSYSSPGSPGSSAPSQDYGGGGGGGGGTYPDGSYPSGASSPSGGQQQPTQVATSGMFGGAALPILAVGAALALAFGKPTSGRRTRRNPRRRTRRAVA